MQTQEKLIAAVREKMAGNSDAAIAKALGLSPQRWNNYTQRNRAMNDDAVIGCAVLLDLEPARMVAAHRADLSQTPRERNFWRRIGAAAVLAGVSSAALPCPAPMAANAYTATVAGIIESINRRGSDVYYVKCAAKILRFFALFCVHLFHATSRTHGRGATFRRALAHRKRAQSDHIQQQAPMRAMLGPATRARFGRVPRRSTTAQDRRTRHALRRQNG